MMTDDNQNTYEAKILETLIKNSERLAIVETEVKNINSKLNWLFGAVFPLSGASILAALYAQPILTALNN